MRCGWPSSAPTAELLIRLITYAAPHVLHSQRCAAKGSRLSLSTLPQRHPHCRSAFAYGPSSSSSALASLRSAVVETLNEPVVNLRQHRALFVPLVLIREQPG
jgi:hypothetical protein